MAAVLIDLNKLKIIRAAEGKDMTRRLEYWADILIPESDFYIGGESRRDFAHFTLMELKMLHRNTIEEELTTEDYQKATLTVYNLSQKLETNEASLGELVKKLGKPLAEPTVKPQIEKRAMKPVSSQPTRPGAGTTTARVWEIADEMMVGDPDVDFESKEFRQAVIEICGNETINPSTAATQFAKWKRDQLTS